MYSLHIIFYLYFFPNIYYMAVSSLPQTLSDNYYLMYLKSYLINIALYNSSYFLGYSKNALIPTQSDTHTEKKPIHTYLERKH